MKKIVISMILIIGAHLKASEIELAVKGASCIAASAILLKYSEISNKEALLQHAIEINRVRLGERPPLGRIEALGLGIRSNGDHLNLLASSGVFALGAVYCMCLLIDRTDYKFLKSMLPLVLGIPTGSFIGKSLNQRLNKDGLILVSFLNQLFHPQAG